jgi:hypothetical protein
MERLLREVPSLDEACNVSFLEGVYQMGSGLSRQEHLLSLARHLLYQSFLRVIPTCVLTGKPEMREVGHRTQPLGIRLTLLEPIADLLDHLIKSVQSQMWQLLFAQFLAIDVPLGSVLDCLLKRAEPAGARRVKPRGFWRAHLYGSEPDVHAPLLFPADCGTIHLRTSCTTHHAALSSRIPGEKLDARCANRRCTHRSDPHRRLPPGNTEGRGGSLTAPRNTRGRKTCARAAGRAGGHSRSGREHPARQAIRGRACPCTPSAAAEVPTRGEVTRGHSATSAALETSNQTSLPFG